MFQSLLPRRIPSLLSPATLTSRTLTPWSHQLPAQSSNLTPLRPFSSTPATLSSPFRLSSNNNPNNASSDNYPPFTPDGEPLPYYSPYQPKRQWPPDMTKLSPKHQFRLERKYRRRAALKYARPKWSKATKLVQWGAIGFVLLYAMLFMEWDERGSPFDEIRRTVFAGIKGAFSTPPPPRPSVKSDEHTKE